MKSEKKSIRLFIREMIEKHVDEERIPNSEADDYVDEKQNFIGSHTYGENLGELDKVYVAYSYGEQHPLYVWIDKDEFNELRPHEAKQISEQGENDGKYNCFYNEEVVGNKESEESDDDYNEDIKEKKGVWFYNERPYYIRDKKGKTKPNKWTFKHLKNLKPNEKTQARNTIYLKKLIRDFKKKYGIGKNSHTCLEPGEK